MLQRQSNPLNRSRTPERREQITPGPARAVSGDQVGALTDRVQALEDLTAAQTLELADHEARIAALEAQAADHEARISALEP